MTATTHRVRYLLTGHKLADRPVVPLEKPRLCAHLPRGGGCVYTLVIPGGGPVTDEDERQARACVLCYPTPPPTIDNRT